MRFNPWQCRMPQSVRTTYNIPRSTYCRACTAQPSRENRYSSQTRSRQIPEAIKNNTAQLPTIRLPYHPRMKLQTEVPRVAWKCTGQVYIKKIKKKYIYIYCAIQCFIKLNLSAYETCELCIFSQLCRLKRIWLSISKGRTLISAENVEH